VMALGRRARKSERAKLDATPPWATDRVRDTDLTTGPYDEADSPEDELERLDLGALRIPVVTGVEVRVDVNPDGQVIAATLSYAGSEAQVGAFAAPRTAGIWDEIRAEIRGSITAQGGTSQESDGRFGTELVGRVPVQGGFQSVRFVGVDGPRWFLRGLFTGAAASDPAKASVLEDAVRNIVVVRGSSPMPVRDPLPLTLPKEIAEQAEQTRGAHAAGEPDDEPEIDEPEIDRGPSEEDSVPDRAPSARRRRR
jgi:Protein of unknown function (DUF3710)